MAKVVVNRDKKNRVHIYLPAFLRDKFDLQNGDKVEVDTNWNHIIITAR
jgi:AbrB family looped-hinge helix DNA binding protein